MNNIPRPKYGEYTLYDLIGRLEGFRCSVGWGQLNEDLEIAIECVQYVADIAKAENEENDCE